MKISFSDRIVQFQVSYIKESDLREQKKGILKNDKSPQKIRKVAKSKAQIVYQVVGTQFKNVISPHQNIDSSKSKTFQNKQNIVSLQKFQRNYFQLNQKSVPNETKIQKVCPMSQSFFMRDQKQLSQNSICKKKSQDKMSRFMDKHMSVSKVSVNEPPKQAYKRFDISKLDFSFAQNLPQHQIQSQKLHKDKQYASLVSKSRSNIKKIIELNRFLKKNQKQVQKVPEKTEEDKFVEDIEILDKIKIGCFGTVFKAKIKSNGRLIAIKSVPYDRRHHQREEEICKMIENPFIVKIYKVYYTYDIEVEKKETFKAKRTQQKLQTVKSFKNDNLANKSVKKFIKSPTKNNIQISVQDQEDQEINLNEELKKNVLNKTRPGKLEEHYNEYHRIINIAMELYDCDLNDYIMMKMKVDNLTLKLFCYQMLRSVLYIHSHQICHRDIKPNNFLVKKHLLVLTDFGSAKFMKNHKNSNVSYICSRYYRAPELILGYRYYDKPIDIWSLGCVMAELSLGKPIFKGSNSLDQLVKIIRIIGQPNWRQISFMMDKLPKLPQIESKGLKSIFPPHVSTLFIDLLESMLVINPLQRITAGEALCHPFFDELRDQMNFQEICKQMEISHFLKFNRDELKQNEHLKNKLIPMWACQQEKYEGFRTNNYINS